MGRFIVVGVADQPVIPFVWKPRSTAPRFVIAVNHVLPIPMLGSATVDTLPEPAAEPVALPVVDEMSLVPVTDSASIPAVDEMVAEPVAEPASIPAVDRMELVPSGEPVSIHAVEDMVVPEPLVSTPAVVDKVAPEPLDSNPDEVDRITQQTRPLSHNLLSIRRALSLTPEEFARPIIDDGEGLINRLEAGFSRPSSEVGNMICETWGICSSYLYTGSGPMFEKDKTDSTEKYVILLIRLLKTYLSVATFDRKGIQYWKGSLVDDLCRLLDVGRLDGRCMSRVVRVLYDYLDVDQFCEVLERMGR